MQIVVKRKPVYRLYSGDVVVAYAVCVFMCVCVLTKHGGYQDG